MTGRKIASGLGALTPGTATSPSASFSSANIIRTQMATATLTIANGATQSGAIDARGYAMFGLVMPAAFTGTTLTFQVSDDNATFNDVYDITNTKVSLTVAVSRNYDLPPELASWPYWKITSGSSEGGSRSLKIVGKG